MTQNNDTVKMMEHFKKEWIRDDIFIVLPEGMKYSAKWDSINRGNIKVLNHKHHKKAEEWTIIVHDVFKFAVVKNKKLEEEGKMYHIQQLQFNPGGLIIKGN